MPADGIVCQVCGIEAPSRYVVFHQNIGALVMRYHRALKGRVCKRCLHKKYWKMTGITLGVGWLGTISIVMAPFLIIANTVQYLKALGMPAVPDRAAVPVLDPAAIAKLAPLAGEIVDRLKNKEDLTAIANDLGPKVQVTPGQVVKYVAALAKQQKAQNVPAAKTYGPPATPQSPATVAAPVAAPVPTLVAQEQAPAARDSDNLVPPLIEI